MQAALALDATVLSAMALTSTLLLGHAALILRALVRLAARDGPADAQ
jgi:hypothetical protein